MVAKAKEFFTLTRIASLLLIKVQFKLCFEKCQMAEDSKKFPNPIFKIREKESLIESGLVN